MSKPWSKKNNINHHKFRKDSTRIPRTSVPSVSDRKTRVCRTKNIHLCKLREYVEASASPHTSISNYARIVSDVENAKYFAKCAKCDPAVGDWTWKYLNANNCTIAYTLQCHGESHDVLLSIEKTVRLDSVIYRKRFPGHRSVLSMCKKKLSRHYFCCADERIVRFTHDIGNDLKYYSYITVQNMCKQLNVDSPDEVITIHRSIDHPRGYVATEIETFRNNIQLFQVLFAVNDYFVKHPSVRRNCGIIPFKGPQTAHELLFEAKKRYYYGSGTYEHYRLSTLMTIIEKLWSRKWAKRFKSNPLFFSDEEFHLLLQMVNDRIKKDDSDSLPMLQKYAGPQIVNDKYDNSRVYYDIRHKYPKKLMGPWRDRKRWIGGYNDPDQFHFDPRESLQSILSL